MHGVAYPPCRGVGMKTFGQRDCIRDAVSNAVPAYSWSAQTYKGRVASLFPNVLSLPVAPFQGMTDILLLGKHAAVVTVSDSIMCIEIGIAKGPTFPVSIGSHMRDWPQKVGELLASMYYFGTCQYLNRLDSFPATISWKSFGVLTIRSVGCLALKMVLDDAGCHVELIHEGCPLSLGQCIKYVC